MKEEIVTYIATKKFTYTLSTKTGNASLWYATCSSEFLSVPGK
jgi:hypothetical protein